MISEDIPMTIKMNNKCFPGIFDLDLGKRIDEGQILEILDFINKRYDCSDFRMVCILRSLYSYQDLISTDTLEKMKETVLDFKYWIDEPGIDGMCYWSENHQLICASIEYLAGALYPDEVFRNNGLTGLERKERAKTRLSNWFSSRYQYGFVEWHSNTYYEEDIAPLSLLIDFAPDEEIGKKATILLDLLLLDIASYSYNGYFVATSGRCYQEQKQDPNCQDVLDIIKKAFDLGPVKEFDYTRLSTDFILNKKYHVPEVLKKIAASKEVLEMKESLGLELSDVPKVFRSKTDFDTTGAYFWSQEAFTNPESIAISLEMFNHYQLQNNTFLKDLKMVDLWILKKLKLLPLLVKILNPVTQGIAIQKANTYAYRHPDYFLSTAQLYHPKEFGDQQHIWQATLGKDISVFTTHPATAFFDDNSRNFSPSYWVGNGINPYGVQDKNIGLYYYDLKARKGFLEKKRQVFSHLYFPAAKFNQVIIKEDRLIGLAGKSLIGIVGLGPLERKTSDEWIQRGRDTAWGVVLSSLSEVNFEEFQDQIANLSISLSRKEIQFKNLKIILKKKPEFQVDGKSVTINYPRYDLPFINTINGQYEINYQENKLVVELDKEIRVYE